MPDRLSRPLVTRRSMARVGVLLGAAGAAGAVATVAADHGTDVAEAAASRWSDHDIRRFGAVSGQDCTAAFEKAARTGAIYLPKGVWTYRGPGLDWSVCQSIVGVGRGLSFVNLGAGTYLFQGAGRTTRFAAADFSIEGGAGAMRLTNTGPDVGSNGMITWDRVDFQNYTACAVSHRFSDAPNWAFRDCSFFAANDKTTVGVALHGDAADSLFDHCTFGRNRCHVKIDSVNGGADVLFRFCDFVRNDPGGSYSRVDIWIVPAPNPSAPGNGAPAITSCKFGPENRSAIDVGILLADAKAGALLWTEPLNSQRSSGEVRGLRVIDCLFGADQPTPLVLSTCAAVTAVAVDRLTLNGALPPYLFRFTAPSRLVSAIRQAYGTVTGLVNKDAGVSTLVKLQNGGYPIAVTTLDPRRSLEGVPELNANATATTAGMKLLSSSDATAQLQAGQSNRLSLSSTHVAQVQGSGQGGQNAFYAWLPVPAAAVGSFVHVEFEVALTSAGSTQVDVALRGDAASASSRIAVSGTAWTPRHVRFLAGGGASQLTISASKGGVSMRIRHLRVYEQPLP